MKKILFALCVLMIVPTLVLASGDMVSVSELRQQVERMGRWTKSYDTPNGEVSVDIPVIVPDVDELSILEIQAVTPEDDGFSWDENDQSVYILSKEDSFTEYADHNLLKFINPQLEADAPSTFFVSERNVMLQAGHDWVYVRRGGRLKYGYKSHYGFEPEIDGIYAEGNINCLLDAKKALQKVLDYFYPREENRFDLDYVEIRERARKVKDLSESGGYVDEYPMGTYYLDLRQVMHGLPIYTGVGERIDSFSADRKFDDAEVKKCFKIEGISISYFEYMTDDSFDIRVCWVREKNMIENDVPLASLQCILREIEQKIKHGNIRNVYALRLGYAYYLNDASPETYTLFPVWVCDCDYTDNSKEKIMNNIVDDNFRRGFIFSQILFNGQNGKMESQWLKKTEMLYCPEVITWENTQ